MKVIFSRILILHIILATSSFLSAQTDESFSSEVADTADVTENISVEEELDAEAYDIDNENIEEKELTWSDCFIEVDSFIVGGADLYVNTKKFRDDPIYNYEKDPKKERGIVSKLWYKFLRWLDESVGFSIPSFSGSLLKYLIIGLGAYLLLRFILQAELGSFLRKKDVPLEEIDSELVDADMSEEDLSQLIEKAEQQGAYRLAIRFRYLRALRKLDDEKIILWKSGKTNINYIDEIKNLNLRSMFMEITKVYEYIWYGEYNISNVADYNEQLRSFQQLEAQI